ncbi:virulence RhuM family protein [Methanimicrococcus sp. OttesenSCG-928-J09]|nr:virulence RhuM family protein [Methanimicrococcus sp. OttesenSCG-928-J09]
MDNNSEFIMYQTEDGITEISVRLDDGTVWLTQAQIAALFQRDVSVISRHIKKIFEEGELDEKSNLQILQIPNSDRPVSFYSLDVIISVGYRIKSTRGTQFRIWANSVLKEYLVKGFAMNDELLKKAGGGNYFDELLARIRDIRSSEKVFWKKILDIYATSVDYSANNETTQLFFQTVQNKMHWAASGHTAAEIIAERADADKPMMGMTSFKGKKLTLAEVKVAKNYLNAKELDTLNRIVSMYLDFAELQAQNHKPMYMNDWIKKLDDFLKISDRDILTHAGKVSRELAEAKAKMEFEKYKNLTKDEMSQIEMDYIASLESAEKKLLNPKNKKQ